MHKEVHRRTSIRLKQFCHSWRNHERFIHCPRYRSCCSRKEAFAQKPDEGDRRFGSTVYHQTINVWLDRDTVYPHRYLFRIPLKTLTIETGTTILGDSAAC
jgi:hypothetical protein